MAANRKSSGAGGTGIMIIIILFLIFGPIITFIFENILVISGVIVGVIGVIGVIIAATHISAKNKLKAQIRQQNLDIIHTQEKIPAQWPICDSKEFDSKEEEKINLEFRDYLKYLQQVERLDAHIVHLGSL